MKATLVNIAAAAGLIDPDTKRRPFIDPATGEPIRTAVDLHDNNFWRRRARDGDIRIERGEPRGNEPIAPLTTRSEAAELGGDESIAPPTTRDTTDGGK